MFAIRKCQGLFQLSFQTSMLLMESQQISFSRELIFIVNFHLNVNNFRCQVYLKPIRARDLRKEDLSISHHAILSILKVFFNLIMNNDVSMCTA